MQFFGGEGGSRGRAHMNSGRAACACQLRGSSDGSCRSPGSSSSGRSLSPGQDRRQGGGISGEGTQASGPHTLKEPRPHPRESQHLSPLHPPLKPGNPSIWALPPGNPDAQAPLPTLNPSIWTSSLQATQESRPCPLWKPRHQGGLTTSRSLKRKTSRWCNPMRCGRLGSGTS